MRIPINKLADALKMGVTAIKDTDEPVRVSVFVDSSATPFLIETIRDAFVPQTTAALVRVQPLSGELSVKADTDISIVITCGSDDLQAAVQQIVVAGAPCAVVCESSVEAPFIVHDTPMLGLIASTNKTHLLETLARWILDRTDKDTAFAANFPFMRIAAAMRSITSCALTNMATGALAFIPGSDFPVMALAQLGMMFDLAGMFGKPIAPERGYEAAGILAGGLACRAFARAAARQVPRMGFVVKALVGAAGTVAMGRALMALYEHDIDYTPANDAVKRAAAGMKGVVGGVIKTVRPEGEAA
ncbi:hypothetical protein H6A18_10705 [Collinsella tanakaei]|uniref:hypothetical protein n=1 Tax=Collinsella tanakaei TaxID=626935 RepID=UPI00195BE4FC|nr:hypothetical protein [Collinsella tanakaei]